MVRRGFVVILLVLLSVRMTEVDVSWSDLTEGQNELRASADWRVSYDANGALVAQR